MVEGFATNYAKAIDDLAGKIFIPALICSLLVEFGSPYQDKYNAGLLETYLVFVLLGAVIAMFIFSILVLVTHHFFEENDIDIASYIAVIIMPLGFAGLFPEKFSNFPVPYSQVTGMAILAWAFMLLNKGAWRKYV